MSLFLKIFLWFWLSIALVVGVLTFVNLSTQSEPLTRQWQTFIGEAVNINSQTAVQIYENEGQQGLAQYLDRVASADRVVALGIFDQNRKQIAGNELSAEAKEMIGRDFDGDNIEFNRLPEQTIAAKKIALDGAEYFYIIQYKRPPQTPFLTEAKNKILQILAVIFTAGLGCYALARYLSSPIGKLRNATQKLAGGDLQTRVADKVGNRHDELAALAKDFDEMAERIETLIDSQKRLTRDVSHELRSPLARLNVALELAKTKSNGDAGKMLDRIERESKQLNDMISQILTLSKLESQSETIEKRDINIGKLVERVVADADFEAQSQDKKVEIIQNSDARIFGNENLLKSAVENVLRNAVRYTNDKVEVSVNGGASETVIKIRDHGAGVPTEELVKLFTPFHRVAEARERKSGGVGLGLAIAEQAVHAHKGKIAAQNAKDGGLIVEIKLPHQN
ncbi:MAG: ATP-binding protein [Pyrinomonadaceae bacterium]